MTKLVIACALLSTSAAFALGDGIKCKNLNGTVEYEYVRIISGVAPREGEKRSWTKLKVDGKTHEDVKVELKNKKQTAKTKRTRTIKTERYSATLVSENPAVSRSVACVQTTYIGPPPPSAPPRGGNTGGE